MNKTIDDILNGMKGQQPTPPDADLLTEQIMMNLPDIQLDATDEKVVARQRQGRGKVEAIINIVRVVSSVAAMWLVGLFAYTFVDTPDNGNEEKAIAKVYINTSTEPSSLCGTLKVAYKKHTEKKTKSLYSLWKEYKKSNI